jgi:hypothetical protein
MSYQSLLTDRCNIFHLMPNPVESRYGVPSGDLGVEFTYDTEADLLNVPCYFTRNSSNSSYQQNEPNRTIIESFLVHFMPSIDIRFNDKVIWNNIEYRLQIPRKIKNHHWEVVAVREGSL